MSKITTEHLARSAYVYIRQSTAHQRRTIMRADAGDMVSPIAPVSAAGPQSRSSTMIWPAGGGIARPGFERLLAAICEARVGAVSPSRIATGAQRP